MTRARARALFVSGLLALLTLVPLGASTQNPASPAAASPAALLDILRAELARNMAVLEKQPVPPYFLAYSVNESRSSQISASFGALTGDQDSHSRTLGVDVRTGDYSLDNTREIRGEPAPPAGIGRAAVPLTDSAPGVSVAAWSATDRAYRQAVERLARVKTNLAAKVKEEDPAPDFSREDPQVSVGSPASFQLDKARVAGPPPPALRGLLRRPSHRPRRGGAERRSHDALPGHHRGHAPPDRRYGLAARHPGGDEGGRRHGTAGLHDLLRAHRVRAARRVPPARRRPRPRRHARQASRRARRRSVLGPGHPLRPRGGRVLPRDLRPPHRGVAPEDRRRRADVRPEGRRADPPAVPRGRCRSHARQARHDRAGRRLRLRRRGRPLAAGGGREERGPHRSSCSADRRCPAFRDRTGTAAGSRACARSRASPT